MFRWLEMRLQLVPLALLLSACASIDARSEVEVRHLLERFVQSVNDANVDAFVACFADDATAFFPSTANAQRRRGVIEIRRAVEPSFAQGPRNPPAQLNDLALTIDGAMAVASFDAIDGAMHSRRTLILRRTHGEWRIVHLHASNVAASQ